MSSANRTPRKSAIFYAMSGFLLFTAASGCASASASRPFSFREALDYADSDEALATAQNFIALQLPTGASRADAVARLGRADMRCGRSKTPDVLDCTAWGSTEDKWSVHVTFDAGDAVSTARVDYEHIGFDDH
jgi:hypothetical protein